MSDVERLLSAFRTGALLRPAADSLNCIDLARAVARLSGVQDLSAGPGADEISSLIGDPDHLVLVVVDGLGVNLVELLPAASFLRQHIAAELLAAFPSTTAVVLTSYATGLWPNQHAVTSWWTHLPEINEPATILSFIRRRDSRPLAQLGVTPEQAFPAPSLLAKFRRDTLVVQPKDIVDSAYSRYWASGATRRGFRKRRFDEATRIAIGHVREAGKSSFTYLYTDQVDKAAHEFGADSSAVVTQLERLDLSIERLADGVPANCRVVVTADHGHLDVPEERVHFVPPRGELCELLRAPPAGDVRLMFFHLRSGVSERFQEIFRRRYGHRFVLLSPDEVERLELFGPGKISPITRRRMGDFMAISLGADAIHYGAEADGFPFRSAHSGLSPEEMRIPLVVA